MKRSRRRRRGHFFGRRAKTLGAMSAPELRAEAYRAEHEGDRARLFAALDEIKRRGLPSHYGHARRPVQMFAAYPTDRNKTREVTSVSRHATAPGVYPALFDEIELAKRRQG